MQIAADGTVQLNVSVGDVITLSSLTDARHGAYAAPPAWQVSFSRHPRVSVWGS